MVAVVDEHATRGVVFDFRQRREQISRGNYVLPLRHTERYGRSFWCAVGAD
jgi:hypothetical protein